MRLTDELWKCVFARLDHAVDFPWRSWEDIESGQLQLLELLKIRLVCKRFDSLYAQQVRRLSLPQHFSAQALPGLVAWMAKSKFPLTAFEANCESQLVDSVVAALAALQTPLAYVQIANIAQPSLQLLSAFGSLKLCALACHNAEDTWRLVSLERLPCLQELRLSGNFIELEVLYHLTCLVLDNADVTSTQECRFASSLKELELHSSVLQGLHEQSLSACSNLADLYLDNSALLDVSGNEQLAANLSACHLDTSCLTQLTLLDLVSDSLDLTELHWLSKMTQIQDLTLTFATCGQNALDKLRMLSALTKLDLGSIEMDTGFISPLPVLHMDCGWSHWGALQELLISDCRLHCTPHSATSLVRLESLQLFSLDEVSCTEDSLFTVAALLGRLDMKSQIELCVPGGSNLSKLWRQQQFVLKQA